MNYKQSKEEMEAYYHEDVKLPQQYYDTMKKIIEDPKLLTRYVTLAVFKKEYQPNMDLSKSNREYEMELHVMMRARLYELKEEGNRIEQAAAIKFRPIKPEATTKEN